MIVYGDHATVLDSAAKLDEIGAVIVAAEQAGSAMERHAALVDGLIAAGELAQGVADAEFEERQRDDDTPAQRACMVLLSALARSVAASWRGDPPRPLNRVLGLTTALRSLSMPRRIVCRQSEGYAYYAVYPELYLEAADALRGLNPVLTVGLRSIGTSLAAMVATALESDQSVLTLRPFGDPFDRRVAIGPRLAERLRGLGASIGVVVDEGPGLSGSSFAAAADCLEQIGVSSSQIVFMPSHCNGPGALATPRHRGRWKRTRLLHQDFDRAFMETSIPEHRLESWVADLIGTPLLPLEDISAGAWRKRHPDIPALPRMERRKFIAVTERGNFLLKFNGLGVDGHAKVARACALSAAGFTPPVIGFRHGFLVEQWRDESPVRDVAQLDRERLVDTLARYIAYRAEHLQAAGDDGASVADLLCMTRVNAEEAIGRNAALRIEQRMRRAAASVARFRPVHIDGRMHSWEWLQTGDGNLVKTDAIDHSRQHDLIGCQDPAWDVAAARIEFALTAAEFDALLRRLAGLLGGTPDQQLLETFSAAYPAFQLGLWLSDHGLDPDDDRLVAAHVARYREALLEFAQ